VSHRIYRITFLLFVIAGAVRLSAQESEVGLWVVKAKWRDTTLGDDNLDKSGQFAENNGYGISLNHYWTGHFSTELSAQRFRAGAILGSHSVEGQTILRAGDVEADAITAMAQWHITRGRVAPYVGAGMAHLSASFEPEDSAETGPFDYENEIAFAGSVGVNVRMTGWVVLAAELKFVPWSAVMEGTSDDGVAIDPFIGSVGVKVRF
jgi:outer membrane protein W